MCNYNFIITDDTALQTMAETDEEAVRLAWERSELLSEQLGQVGEALDLDGHETAQTFRRTAQGTWATV